MDEDELLRMTTSVDQRVPHMFEVDDTIGSSMEEEDTTTNRYNFANDSGFLSQNSSGLETSTQLNATRQLMKLQESSLLLEQSLHAAPESSSPNDILTSVRKCRSEPELSSLSTSPPPPIRPRTSSAAQSIPFRPRRVRASLCRGTPDFTNDSPPQPVTTARTDVTPQSRVRFNLQDTAMESTGQYNLLNFHIR